MMTAIVLAMALAGQPGPAHPSWDWAFMEAQESWIRDQFAARGNSAYMAAIPRDIATAMVKTSSESYARREEGAAYLRSLPDGRLHWLFWGFRLWPETSFRCSGIIRTRAKCRECRGDGCWECYHQGSNYPLHVHVPW